MSYIDGFLIPVRTQDRDRYREHEMTWWPYFKARGALTLGVGWGDDVPAGKHTDFRRAVDLHPDETVAFAWITWPDKDTRDRAYAKMMEDVPETEMPFDGKRTVIGGFTTLIDEH